MSPPAESLQLTWRLQSKRNDLQAQVSSFKCSSWQHTYENDIRNRKNKNRWLLLRLNNPVGGSSAAEIFPLITRSQKVFTAALIRMFISHTFIDASCKKTEWKWTEKAGILESCRCQNKGTAGILWHKCVLCFLVTRHICSLMCVHLTYHIRAGDDIWQSLTAAPLALCSCSSPGHWPQPLGAIRASHLSSAARRACPPFFHFPLLVFRSRPEQQKTTALQQAPPPSAALLPLLQTQMCIYLAQICPCVINRRKL